MKKQSIRKYLFKTVVTTLLAISAVIFAINIIITNSVKEDYIYHELEEARDGYNMIVRMNDQIQEVISFVVENGRIKLTHPKKMGDDIMKELWLVVEDYERDYDDEGVLAHRGMRIYYIVEETPSGLHFYILNTSKNVYVLELMLVIVIVLLAVFIASYRISNYLAKPVNQLTQFSEEIAHKNWHADIDEIDNLELSQLGQALVVMKDKLEQADKEERQFFQATSHDLKTPIMIIKGYAQASIDGMPVKGDMPYDQVVLKEAERLERKVNQLVRLNAVGYTLEQTDHFEEIRIDRILRSLTSKFDTVSELTFDVSLETMECLGDGEALMIAFENIIDNQLRYAKSKIYVKMSDQKIYIGNDGPHFEDDPNDMFEIYKKGVSGNFGLGLAITKKVIQAHLGNIKAHNEDEGICFEITLPMHKDLI